MPNNFTGSLEDLKATVAASGLEGDWQDESDKHTFKVRGKKRGVIIWWPSTTTLQFQGSEDVRSHNIQRFETALGSHASGQSGQSPANGGSSRRNSQQIFIVHGHDTEARDQLELSLRRLGLEPFILMNSSGGGKTIIEALEGKIGKDFSTDFGIVLMTPDDTGYALKDGEEKAEPRARQNVILETGMLLSSLTRERMALIVKGHIELPSDLQGIIHFGYNHHIKEVVNKLCKRLRECGFDLDPDKISEASA